ncbi:hypothetical protein B4U80_02826, partial [Leptotrombidium deliense]
LIVFATGYDISFRFIDSSNININNNEVKLYKNVLQPNLKHPQTFAIKGMIQVSGSFIPVSEMQSRWFAQLMKGDQKLPTKQDISFPFIDSSIININNNEVKLYKNVFQANLKQPQT